MNKSVENSNSSIAIVPEVIENRVFLIRGQKVMFDKDLAVLYDIKHSILIKPFQEI